jgi:HK97 family phage major capsid protein
MSNEIIDDAEPSAVEVVNRNMTTMLALKLDRGIYEGNPTGDADSIRGLKYVSGIQNIDLGTNGAALSDYDPFIEAVGLLRAANVPGPYVVAAHPSVITELELLKEDPGSNVQLGRPADLPAFYASSQFTTTETKGTATDARSAYVYAPDQVVLVRRKDAEVELDRSRLFHQDASEMRAKLRADLIVPNPVAVVRIEGIVPAA